jgi:hypothetical protein
MIPDYASQQLRAAVSILACGRDRLQNRLASAYRELEPLIAADFPDGLGNDYQDIVSGLIRIGSVAATTADMSDSEASHFASLIVNLCFATEAAKSTKPSTSSSQSPIDA